jgi:hypothetical protein
MVRNQTVLKGLLEILGQRGISLDAWELSIGWDAGSIVKALQPPDGSTINRNIKLLAHKLDVEALEFLELLERMEREEG